MPQEYFSGWVTLSRTALVDTASKLAVQGCPFFKGYWSTWVTGFHRPNIGWPQATMAGLLGIQLGGGAFYDGLFVEKPYIGDDTRAVRAKDIDDSIKIIRKSMLSFLILYSIGLLIYTLVR